jgi:hypothetical protein
VAFNIASNHSGRAGGFREARWARRGEGKNGGFRMIYYIIIPPGRIYTASIFPKSRRQNLSEADENALAKIPAAIKKEARGAT